MSQFYYEGRLEPGKEFFFSLKESAHLKVFRVKKGEKIKVFSPFGRFEAVVKDFLDKKVLALALNELESKAQKPKIKLYFSFLEKNAFEDVLRKATETGCDVFTPLICQYTQKEHIFDLELKRERLNEIILSAVKQCERAEMPFLQKPVSFEEVFLKEKKPLLFSKTDWQKNPSLKISSVLEKLEDEELALLVGPEGGFSEKELYFARDKALFVSLGENVLRAETAAAVACSLLRAL